MDTSPPDEHLSRFFQLNRQEHKQIYNQLTFITNTQASIAEQQRTDLLNDSTLRGAKIGCSGSKIYVGELSPGCRLCTAGVWSCLFINGRCNRSCFYCPSPQDDIGEPTTNNLGFSSANDYLAYLQHFNFRGFSLSGGEPLLTLERSINYLSVVKKHFGSNIHSWIYTNGSLVNADVLARLRDCGLDEIRFDIGAMDFSLEKAVSAVGLIPTVTIEIPAIPEEKDHLKALLKPMADQGINFLNLHQLRLTNHNYRHFKKRSYTYLHGEKITVLESELTALETIHHALDQRLNLSVNYCSFVFKNRFQAAAARARGTAAMGKPHEQTTASGYLRSCSVTAEPHRVQDIAARFNDADPAHWSISPGGNQLFFAAPLWHQPTMGDLPVHIDYAQTRTSATLSYRHPFRELKLSPGRSIYIERSTAAKFLLNTEQAACFFNQAASIDVTTDTSTAQPALLPAELLPYEHPPAGLQPYF